jgi:hypothetical protein
MIGIEKWYKIEISPTTGREVEFMNGATMIDNWLEEKESQTLSHPMCENKSQVDVDWIKEENLEFGIILDWGEILQD